jgi:phosphoglycerol transferase MdoB-like AlkP superfamily enzyme
MSLEVTLIVLVASVSLAGFAWRMQRRPRDSFDPPLVPWTAVQVVAVVVALLMAAHLVSLATGQPLKGRRMF